MGWVFGHAACVLFQYFTYVPVYGSVYTLVLMSADRYLAVVHPIRSIGLRNQRNTLIAVAATWLLISVCHVPFAVDVGVINMGSCRVDNFSVRPLDICANRRFLDEFGGFSASGKLFYTLFGLLGYLLPFLVIITLYACWKLTCGRAAGVSKSGEAARSKRRVTRMVVIVIVIFGTCWLPIHVVFALQMWYKDFEDDWFRYLQAGSQMLAYMNSCVNPILYAFLSENFRQAFAKFLGIQLKPKTRRDNHNWDTRAPSPPASTASGRLTATVATAMATVRAMTTAKTAKSTVRARRRSARNRIRRWRPPMVSRCQLRIGGERSRSGAEPASG
uniref:G_PROTEIN_RECEP_F1_2 domain-containing protein n=1 Tax=Macrostomum lignano TaxID=282301 RepID=A0A1I8JNM0_9PLAT